MKRYLKIQEEVIEDEPFTYEDWLALTHPLTYHRDTLTIAPIHYGRVAPRPLVH